MLEELLALGHVGAEYDAWLINIGQGDQFGSGFVAINPNSKIPALLDRSGPKPIRVFESGSILLTGGSSGLGLALAHAFLAKGAKVVITGRRPDALAKAVQELRENYSHVWSVAANVASSDGRAATIIVHLKVESEPSWLATSSAMNLNPASVGSSDCTRCSL